MAMVKSVHSSRPASTMENPNVNNQLPRNRAIGSTNSNDHHTPSRRFLIMIFGLGLISVFAMYHFISIGLSTLFFKLHVLQQEQKRDVSHPAYYSKVYKKDSHLLKTPADVLDSSSNSSTTSTVALLAKKRIGAKPDAAITQDKTETGEGNWRLMRCTGLHVACSTDAFLLEITSNQAISAQWTNWCHPQRTACIDIFI